MVNSPSFMIKGFTLSILGFHCFFLLLPSSSSYFSLTRLLILCTGVKIIFYLLSSPLYISLNLLVGVLEVDLVKFLTVGTSNSTISSTVVTWVVNGGPDNTYFFPISLIATIVSFTILNSCSAIPVSFMIFFIVLSTLLFGNFYTCDCCVVPKFSSYVRNIELLESKLL